MLTIALSYIFYIVVEKPSHQLARKLANYIKYFFNERIMQSIKKSLIIDCIELNKDKFDILSKDFPKAIHGDFLKLDIKRNYDLIIAAPPFKGNTDLEHIMKMYDVLKVGGEIISLT